MKTKLNKTLTKHPKCKYTCKGILVSWKNLAPFERKYVQSQQGMFQIIMDRGKKYVVIQ